MNDESPMREAGKGGSAVLERLASAPTSTAGIPDQSKLLSASDRQDRQGRALALPGTGSLWWLVAAPIDFFAIMMLIGAAGDKLVDSTDHTLAWLLPLLGLGLTIVAVMANGKKTVARDAVKQKALGWAQQFPFPVTGYENWLACDRPLVDLHMRRDFDGDLFRTAVTSIDPAIGVEIVDGNTARLAIPPVVGSRGKAGSVRYGNVPLLHRVFAELIVPLHDDTGVERVELGGLVDERPAS